ncbi:MAG: response regulator [Verrucomicrobiota bacterium]|nr:response regulator [Verrucomicrobiota bacterium]
MSTVKKVVVLVVDDNKEKRELSVRYLFDAGFTVWEATDGEECLIKAEKDPSVILFDVHIPDIARLGFCQQLRANPKTTKIPIICVSATFPNTANLDYDFDGEADGYLTGPIAPAELISTIKALLRWRKAEEVSDKLGKDWQITFNSISDPVSLLNEDGIFHEYNSAMVTFLDSVGLNSEVVSFNSFCALFDPLGSDFLHQTLQSDTKQTAELRAGLDWYSVIVEPVVEKNSKRFVLVLRKTTEQKMERDALSETALRKDQFLAVLGHELRNPLTAIKIGAENMLEGGLTPEDEFETRKMIVRQSRHLSRMMEDLLDMTRISRGSILLRKEPVDLRSVVSASVKDFQYLVNDRKIELKIHSGEVGIYVEADTTRLSQILGNLIHNACKFSQIGGKVEITLHRESGMGSISVKDEGIGMTQEFMKSIFRPFSQAEPAGNGVYGGLGLGLALVRELARLMGGDVKATSDGPNKGSMFKVQFPVIEHVPVAAAVIKKGPKAKLNILVVEDSPDTARALQIFLELEGNNVQTAGSGEEALINLDKWTPHVIFSDLGLPAMDGFTLATKIREKIGSETYLVALSGLGRSHDIERTKVAGFDSHITKPPELEDLRKVLRRVSEKQANGSDAPIAVHTQ